MQLSLPWNTSFVAIDFETAMNHHICSVGIVTVTNGEIVDEFHALIQPPNNEYSWHTIQVHGITPNMTQYSPNFYHVYPEIKKRLLGNLVVAHNESFDRGVIQKTMKDYGLDYQELQIANKWECTMRIYRSKGYKPAKLNSCCEVHGIQLKHHDALSDAKACAKLYLLAL
jgi:DNA polymerase-3 subunit epsilon